MRKVVTVLFCDVTGSTALGERIDPESLRRVMARYFETAKAIVERHGGTVEKFIGDAVMAVFGVPTVHEDDALRAVRAADELRGGLGDLNDELERDYGTRLELRMGVNTGEVVTGTEERLATGDAVNVAARLEQAAPPGEVLLGEETHRLVATRSRPSRSTPSRPRGSPSRSSPTGCSRCRRRPDVATTRRWSVASASWSCSRTRSRPSRTSARASSSRFSAPPGSASRASPRSSCGRSATRSSSAAAVSPTARGLRTGR